MILEVNNVLPVVKVCDWERERLDAECFWVYYMMHKVKEYGKVYGLQVRCADLLPTLLSHGLLVQEEKMKKVIQDSWDENVKLRALKRVKTQGNVPSLESLSLERRRLNTGVVGIKEMVTIDTCT